MDGSGCEQQSETGWKSRNERDTPLPFITNIPRIDKHKIHNGICRQRSERIRTISPSAAADGSFRSPLPPRRFISSSIRFIFLPLRDIAYYDPYTRPLCASFRELFPTEGDISVDCLMTDLATDVSSWNSSGDHSYLTFPGARFFFFLISFFFFNWNNR